MMNKFLDFFFENENIIGHGNFTNIDESYNLLAEKESVDRSIRQIPQKVITKTAQISATNSKKEAPQENQKDAENLLAAEIETENKTEDGKKNTSFSFSSEGHTDEINFSHIDDESLRKIYETIHKINEFEKKSKELRKLKFAKRDNSI